MNIIKRALMSVTRRSGKSALLMTIIFILGVVVAGAISVQQALENTKSALAQKIGITATVKMIDNSSLLDRLVEQPDLKIEALSMDVIDAIGSSSQVKSYDYSAEVPLTYQSNDTQSTFTLCCRKETDFSELSSGEITIVKGRGLSEEDGQSQKRPVVMSAQAAEKLKVSTGSELELRRDIYYGKELRETLKYTFVVVGLFDTPQEEQSAEKTSGVQTKSGQEDEDSDKTANLYILMDNASNIISGINNAENRINGINAQRISIVPTYVLKARTDVEGFCRVVEALAPSYYTVSDNTEQFDYMTAPTTNMEWIAQIVIIASVAASVAVISLVMTLFMRDRRAELGTYFSLGERKRNIALQILLEILAVAIVALSASLLIGNAVAGAVSGEMLKTEVTNAANEEGQRVVVSQKIDSQAILESYHVSLNGATIALFYGAGLLTVALSTVAPVLYTLRQNPKKILLA